MTATLTTRDHYIAVVREYDAIANYACEMSTRLSGRRVVEKHLSYAETIFTKLVCHCVSLRRLVPTFRAGTTELWDIGAVCAIARTLIEAFDALAYIGLHQIPPQERELRMLVWELHGQERRLSMLGDTGAIGPDVDAVRDDAKALRDATMAHALFGQLSAKAQKDISLGKAPAFTISQRERNAANGINHDFYNVVTMFLSQYVHTLPFALSQLTLAHAGDPEALQTISMTLKYSLPFIAKAVAGIGELWPDVKIEPTEDQRLAMDVWSGLAENGVKGLRE